MILSHIKTTVKNPNVVVGNKFLALMLLNSLMRTKNKQFLGYIDEYFLPRLMKIAKENKDYKGLNAFCQGDISNSREAHKFYHLLG
jgi:hypothetical protein